MSTWDDGTVKSTDNAFCVAYKPSKKPTWSQKLSNQKKSSMNQSRLVSAKQAQGEPIGVVRGMSRKSDELLAKQRHGGQYTRAKK